MVSEDNKDLKVNPHHLVLHQEAEALCLHAIHNQFQFPNVQLTRISCGKVTRSYRLLLAIEPLVKIWEQLDHA
jgi:hypothetical protein